MGADRGEFGGGGLLTALGLLGPVGPLAIGGSMVMAARTAHRDKPIWVTEGGPELPVTNLAIVAALILAGPGSYSLDRAFDLHLPAPLVALAAAATAVGVAFGLNSRVETAPNSLSPAA